MEFNISNVNALQSAYAAPHPTYIAPQPTYAAPSYEYIEPSYGYGYGCAYPAPCHNTFVLVVVLFILLIIIGACYLPRC
ncbi:YjcZ family sporulation protein [Bacillus sp. JJ1533]|uniref:YjcZ family sporulation protein n=1 Tax=Bacillus sp. JJ1533 TaxID=3122959 RepID=UPI002FFDC99D